MSAIIHIAESDDMSQALRGLLDLADDVNSVKIIAGTRNVEVPEELAQRWAASRALTELEQTDRAPDETAQRPRRSRRGSTTEGE